MQKNNTDLNEFFKQIRNAKINNTLEEQYRNFIKISNWLVKKYFAIDYNIEFELVIKRYMRDLKLIINNDYKKTLLNYLVKQIKYYEIEYLC